MSKDKKVVFVCSGCDKNTLNNDLEMFHYCISCLKKLKEEIKDVEYTKLLKDLEFDGLDSVSYEYGLKKGKEDASNVFLPEQGKNKHEIEVLKIELKRVSKLYNSALLSVPVSTDLEIEVRVREEMVNKFKGFLKKHEVMFFGCDCSDCKTMEDDFEENFLVSEQTGKDSSLNVINCVSSSKNEKDFVNSKSVSKETKKQNKNEVQKE